MKRRTYSLSLLVLLWSCVMTAFAQNASPFKLTSPPGRLVIKSVDEQDLPESEKAALKARARRAKEQKISTVSDHQISDFAAAEADYRSSKTSFADLVSRGMLSFTPANVDATSLRGQPLVGALPSGLYSHKTWTGVSRLFRHRDLGLVVLEETDFSTEGQLTFTQEMINADVNGAPAVFLSRQGGPRKSETILTWFNKGMLYKLHMRPVDDRSRDEILDIARHILKV